MNRDDPAISVPGERWPALVPASLIAIGTVLCASSVAAENADRAAPVPAVPASPAVQAPAPSVPTPAPPSAAESQSAAPVAAVAPPKANDCPPLVVTFDMSASEGSPGSMAALSSLADKISGAPRAHLIIEGHADASGDELYNLKLSKQRATWVAGVLKARGVAADRLTVRGLGTFSPAERTDDADAVNRRVVVHLREFAGCAPVATSKEQP